MSFKLFSQPHSQRRGAGMQSPVGIMAQGSELQSCRSSDCAPNHGQPPWPALSTLSLCSGSQLSLCCWSCLPWEGEALRSEVGLIYCSSAQRWVLKQCVCS